MIIVLEYDAKSTGGEAGSGSPLPKVLEEDNESGDVPNSKGNFQLPSWKCVSIFFF